MHARLLYLFLVLLTLLAASSLLHGEAAAQAPRATPVAVDLTDPLPLDPNVRVGELENGFRFYVRRNTEPARRAELHLAVNAGSILEDEDQLGLAHFVEHMLFNGTRHFPGDEVQNFLESTGMRFGPDVNAYTSFDETVYTLTIPTDSARIVENAFKLLEDWAGYATMSGEMIDRERGVVMEEWRMSDQNAQGRIREQILPVLLHGSRYKDRLPIGKPEIIETAPYEAVRRFYERWYRPDLMAIIAVGDFDPDHFEALIRQHFGGLPQPTDPPDRPMYEVPGHEESLVAIVTDPEYPIATVTVYFKRPADVTETVGDYRDRLIASLFNGMLNERLTEISRRADAPFLGASVFRGAFVRTSSFYGLTARVQEDGILSGLGAVLTEAARVRRHGFVETELERQKQRTLRSYQRAYNERETTNSVAFASQYVSHFLEDEPAPGIAYEFETVQDLLPDVTLEEVNRLAADLLARENRAVTAVLPEKDDLVPPSEPEILAVLESVQERDVEPYVDAVLDAPLIAEALTPAPVLERQTFDEIDVTEITLANGVRVVMKPTRFREDQVQMTAFSPGGSSLVSDDEAFAAETAARIISRSGVGDFNRTELDRHLAGKVVSVSPYVGELDEGFNGSASPEDLETLLQLVHLYFTRPRADADALASFQNELRSSLVNRSAEPFAVYQDSLQAVLYQRSIRRMTPTIEMVDALNPEASLELFTDRFADASDFTFVFAGNLDVDSLTTLARTYLGNLPARSRNESWRDVSPARPDGIARTHVHRGVGQQSWVALVFHGAFEFDRMNRHRLRSLGDVLTVLLRRDLREDLGGVYNVGVNVSTSARPESEYTLFINFGCAPERAGELMEAVFDRIERLKTEGPPEDVLANVKEQQRRQREVQLETNGFWVNVLEFYFTHDEDLMDVLRYNELIESLTAEDVREAARRFLDTERYVEAILYPEGFHVGSE